MLMMSIFLLTGLVSMEAVAQTPTSSRSSAGSKATVSATKQSSPSASSQAARQMQKGDAQLNKANYNYQRAQQSATSRPATTTTRPTTTTSRPTTVTSGSYGCSSASTFYLPSGLHDDLPSGLHDDFPSGLLNDLSSGHVGHKHFCSSHDQRNAGHKRQPRKRCDHDSREQDSGR